MFSFENIPFVFDSSAVDDDVDVDGCDVAAAGVEDTSTSVGDFMTELSASVSSSIKAWTFENTPRRAKLSKNSLPVFNIISSSIFNTTKCPSSSSYFEKKEKKMISKTFSLLVLFDWRTEHNDNGGGAITCFGMQ